MTIQLNIGYAPCGQGAMTAIFMTAMRLQLPNQTHSRAIECLDKFRQTSLNITHHHAGLLLRSLSKVRFLSTCLAISWKCLETLFDSVSSFVSRWVRSCTSASAERPVGSCGGRATGSRCPWVKRNVPGVVALPQLQHISIHFHSPVSYTTILPSNSCLHLFTLSVLSCSMFFQTFQLSAWNCSIARSNKNTHNYSAWCHHLTRWKISHENKLKNE